MEVPGVEDVDAAQEEVIYPCPADRITNRLKRNQSKKKKMNFRIPLNLKLSSKKKKNYTQVFTVQFALKGKPFNRFFLFLRVSFK